MSGSFSVGDLVTFTINEKFYTDMVEREIHQIASNGDPIVECGGMSHYRVTADMSPTYQRRVYE